jgi:hypothetical protein
MGMGGKRNSPATLLLDEPVSIVQEAGWAPAGRMQKISPPTGGKFKSVMVAMIWAQLQAMFFPTAHSYGFRLCLKLKAIISLNVVSRYVFVLQAKRVLADNIRNKLKKQVTLIWTVIV